MKRIILLCLLTFIACDATKWKKLWNPVSPWTIKADMPTERASLSCAVLKEKIYAIGGYDWVMELGMFFIPSYGESSLQTVEVYDPRTDMWMEAPSLLTDRFGHVSATIDGKIYVFGGKKLDSIYSGEFGPVFAYSFLSSVEVYDPLKEAWFEKSTMPTARMQLGCAVVNGKVYLIGGIGESYPPLSTVEEYDPLTNSWQEKAPMPTPRYGLTCAVVDNKVYAIGGIGMGDSLQVVEEYDPTTNSWKRRSPMTLLKGKVACGVVNNKIYVMGNCDHIEVYDPATDTWEIGYYMLTTRSNIACTVVNNKIYVIGGDIVDDGQWAMAIVEEYDPSIGE